MDADIKELIDNLSFFCGSYLSCCGRRGSYELRTILSPLFPRRPQCKEWGARPGGAVFPQIFFKRLPFSSFFSSCLGSGALGIAFFPYSQLLGFPPGQVFPPSSICIMQFWPLANESQTPCRPNVGIIIESSNIPSFPPRSANLSLSFLPLSADKSFLFFSGFSLLPGGLNGPCSLFR